MDISGKKVTILGGQRSGAALARLALRLGAQAKVSDQGGPEKLDKEFLEWIRWNNVDLECGSHTRAFIEDSDVVVLSPGVRLNAPAVQWARSKGILVLGEIEFAYQFCAKPIIAVTGSNGKTTVSTLIKEILQRAGHKACLCGNVGFPFSGFTADLGDVEYVVLEISSFQLESVLGPESVFRDHGQRSSMYVRGFQPHIAVFLNFSQNHLDRHKDLQEYLEAKKRIFINQQADNFLVLNQQDPYLRDLSSEAKSRAVFFNESSGNGGIINPNHSAVMSVGRILGVNERCCREVFAGFAGVEHRLEKVRRIDGVDFVNDSKATTVQAALWALESIHQPIVMICGGRDKNVDFSVLAGPVRQKVKRMIVIGEARAKIRETFHEFVALEECEGLDEAVARARQSAAQGDCVLLSPMCASFDMFIDYEDRGRVFKRIVNQLV